jgi:cytochrome c556
MAGAFLNMFPVGTHQGSAHKTRAKSSIWAQNAQFAAAGKRLVSEARALAAAAKGGDAAAMGKQFGRMAKLGCGGCHRPFRGPKG